MFVREESGTHLGFLGGVVSQAAWNDHGVVGVLDEPKVQDGVCKLPKGRAEVVRSPHPSGVDARARTARNSCAGRKQANSVSDCTSR